MAVRNRGRCPRKGEKGSKERPCVSQAVLPQAAMSPLARGFGSPHHSLIPPAPDPEGDGTAKAAEDQARLLRKGLS